MPPQQTVQGGGILRPGQFSFAGGEYSPDMYSRVDLAKYKIGLRTCRNFIAEITGNASNRGGLRYIASSKYSNKPSYMRRFIFSTTQAYLLEFGDGYIRFYLAQSRAQIQVSGVGAYAGGTAYNIGDLSVSGGINYYCIQAGTGHTPVSSPLYWYPLTGTIYEIPSPYAVADVPNLRFEQSADTLYIMHQSYQQRTVQRFGDTDWVMSIFSPPDGPFMLENVDTTSTIAPSALTGSITLSAAKPIFNVKHIGALWKLIHYMQGQTYNGSLTATGAGTAIPCFTTWRIVSNGTWTAQFNVEKSLDGGTTWTVIRSFSSVADFNVDTFGTEDPTVDRVPFLVRVNVKNYTSGTIGIVLTADAFYQVGIVKISAFTDSQHVTATVLQSIGLVANTFQWAEGAWSDFRGYPALARFYQDRLDFSDSPAEPDTNWLSKSSNYTSFGVSNPTQDDDAITIPLPSRQLNAINGLIAFQQLICFTSGGSWTVQATTGNVVTPNTVFQQPEEYYGSNGILEPIVIGREVIFVETHNKVVRNISFNLYYNGYLGSKVSVLADHLFQNKNVVCMQYASYPDSIIWFLMDDGTLVGLTYLKEQDVVAFHRHDTQGTILSICAVPGASYDELWITVQRDNGIFVEVMEQRIVNDVRMCFFVDSGLSYNNPLNITGATQANPVVITSAAHGFTNGDLVDIDSVEGMIQLNGNRYKIANVTTNTFSLENYGDSTPIDGTHFGAYDDSGFVRKCFTTFVGMDHLNGQLVSLLGDGFVYTPQTVGAVSGGIGVVLPEPVSVLQSGLQYLPDLETLNVDVQQAAGSMQGKLVQIPNAVFRFVNSRGGWVGPAEFDEDGNPYLKEGFIPTRKTLSPPALYTGDMRQEIAGNFEDGGRIFYRQYDPLPVTIGAIIPEVNIGGVRPD